MEWLRKLIGGTREPATAAPDRPPVDPGRRPETTPRALALGWNGLAWGASSAEFRERFPEAHASHGWLRTGRGRESFCGIFMDSQYAFNHRDQFYMVALYPAVEDRDRVSVAAVNELGAPDGMSIAWSIDDVVVEVKTGGVAVSITNRRLAG